MYSNNQLPPSGQGGSFNVANPEQQVTPAISDRYTIDTEVVRKQFDDTCAALRVDEETYKRAVYFFTKLIRKTFPQCSTQEEAQQGEVENSNIWLACSLFIASMEQVPAEGFAVRERSFQGFRLTKLLLECNVTLSDLFSNLDEAMMRCSQTIAFASLPVQQVLSQLKYTFVVITLLHKKFELLWDVSRNYLELVSTVSISRRASLSEKVSDVAWLLFITMRRKQYGKVHLDLASLYKLMVAIVFFVRYAPMRVDQGEHSVPVDGKVDKKHLLQKLCIAAKLEADQVEELIPEVKSFLATLASQGTVRVPKDIPVEQSFDLETLAGEMMRSRLSLNYETEFLLSAADFDERVFLDKQLYDKIASTPAKLSGKKGALLLNPEISRRKLFVESVTSQPSSPSDSNTVVTSPAELARNANSPTVPGSPSSSNGVMKQYWFGSPAPNNSNLSQYSSPMPCRKKQPPSAAYATPVSAAVEASSWLRRETGGGAPQGPSGELRRFFGSCNNNPESKIDSLLCDFREAVLAYYAKQPGTSVSSTLRFEEERALQPLEDSTTKPLKKKTPSKLAIDALEMASKIYYTALESILLLESERLQTKRFDSLLHNVAFHRALYACAMEVVCCAKQMFALMYPASLLALEISPFHLIKVIESFVKGVPSLPQMLRQHMNVIEEDILESQAWKTGSVVLNMFESKSTTTETGDTQQQTQLPSQTPRVTALGLIQSKLFALAMSRIKSLCMELSLAGQFANDAWLAVQYCITEKCFLLQDRHLDQLILCSLYGVAKVKKMKQVTFKSIIRAYRDQQPYVGHSSGYEKIIKQVLIGPRPEDRADIIKFYNTVYVPATKSFLLQFQVHASPKPTSAMDVSPLPPIRGTQGTRQRVKGTMLWMSPRTRGGESSEKGSHMTPRTVALYAFGESPARDLQLMNRSLTAKRKSRLSQRASLNLDGDGEEDEQYAKRARRSRVGIAGLRKQNT